MDEYEELFMLCSKKAFCFLSLPSRLVCMVMMVLLLPNSDVSD